MHAAANTSTNDASLCRLSNDEVEEVRAAVATNESAPESVLTTLSSDQSWLVRAGVASNAHTPGRILVNLSHDEDKRVRMRVVLNRNTPGVVRILLRHKDIDVDVRKYASRPIASQRESVPSRTKAEVCNQPARNTTSKGRDEDGETYSEKKLAALFQSALLRSQPPSPIRRFLFTFPQCPSNILAKNFRSRCWLERFVIAGNPSTPDAVLKRMANEGNQLVRRAAQSNLDQRAAKAD